MGLGPLMAIYQAGFMRYMIDRGFMEDTGRKVFAFLGDGEMDEPESKGALTLASRENLDNLVLLLIAISETRWPGPRKFKNHSRA